MKAGELAAHAVDLPLLVARVGERGAIGLDRHPLLGGNWPAAIKEAEPKARRVNLPGATIHDIAELDDWLERVRGEVEDALANALAARRAAP